jgi:hypothetical protein
MKIFHITRTKIVTERFRVTEETEEDAYDALASEAFTVEKVEENTLHSVAETTKVEECD